jgi:hypothetical protein
LKTALPFITEIDFSEDRSIEKVAQEFLEGRSAVPRKGLSFSDEKGPGDGVARPQQPRIGFGKPGRAAISNNKFVQ